ncbi:MAG: DUF2344 domain-containing protein [Elusimicrobia bacterium]|nr:DUF2344 domain-containing protein [Elusimicrobiota bacterium]
MIDGSLEALTMASASPFELTLEKASAMSLRPSQYAGWEIGSTAALQLGSGREKQFRVALVWPDNYDGAMQDDLLISFYERLAGCRGIAVERFFLPGPDFVERMARLGHSDPWFSLETKSELADFDAFILGYRKNNQLSDGLARAVSRIAESRGGKTPVAQVPSEGNKDHEPVIAKILNDLNIPPDRSEPPRHCALFGYRSREDRRLADLFSRLQDSSRRANGAAMTTWRVKLRRFGWSRFVSHLEQIQLIKSAVALSGVPIIASAGRKPRLKISFGPAVSVGWLSEIECFDMTLGSFFDAGELVKKLAGHLPLGYEVIEARRIPCHFPSLEESANWAEYLIENRNGSRAVDWEKFLNWTRGVLNSAAEPVVIKKEKPGKRVDIINVREIFGAAALAGRQKEGIHLALRFGPGKNLKPEKILEAALGLEASFIQTEIKICRMALALESGPEKRRYL